MGFWDGLSKSFHQVSGECIFGSEQTTLAGEKEGGGEPLLSTITIFALEQTPTTIRSIKIWKNLLVLPKFQIKSILSLVNYWTFPTVTSTKHLLNFCRAFCFSFSRQLKLKGF